jgi:hypothetical protein
MERKIFFSRFGISTVEQRPNMLYCSEHEMEIRQIKVKFVNHDGRSIEEVCLVKVPVDTNEPPSRTRNQQQHRKPVTKVVSRNVNIVQYNNHQDDVIDIDQEPTKHRSHRFCTFRTCMTSDVSMNSRKVRWRRLPSGTPIDMTPITKKNK